MMRTGRSIGRPAIPGATQLTGPGVHDGDSLTSFSYTVDPARWGLPATRKAPKMVLNYGTANDTLQSMLDRQSTTIAGAQAAGATFVIFRGGTNGAGGGDFLTKYAQLIDAYIAGGLFVFCHQIPPTGSGGASKVTLNAGIDAICESRPLTTRYVEDCNGIADGSYNVVSGYTSDGIHFSPTGSYVVGLAQAAIFAEHFATDPRVVDSGGVAAQWVTNPLMTGTGGSKSGGTGTVPDGYSVSSIGVGTSFVASIVAADGDDPVQVPWLRVQLAASGGSGHSWEIRTDMAHGAIAADYTAVQSVDTIAEVRFVSLDTTNLTTIAVGPDSSRTFIQSTPREQLHGNGTISRTQIFRNAYLRAGPSSYSANSLKAMIEIVATTSFASPAGYVDVRCVSAIGGLF